MSTALKTLARPFTAVGSWYGRVAKEHPVTTAIVTTGLKTSAADLFAQKVVEGRDEIDWVRHTAFSSFGVLYLGGFQYWLYNIQFTRLCAPITARVGHRGVAPIKVFLDQAIHHPLLYFPFFYGLKAFVEGKPLASAAAKYKAEAWESCTALWKVWVPAQLVNFAFVPRHLRIPYVAAVSFGWTVILSTMQGQFDARDKAAAEAAALAQSTAPISTLVPPPPTSKKGGDVAVPAAPAPRGLKDVTAAPARQPGGAIVAASRAEAASLVAACAAGGGAMPPQ